MDGRQDDVHLRDLVYNVGHRQLQMCGSVCLLIGLNYSVFILCLLAIFALSVFVCLTVAGIFHLASLRQGWSSLVSIFLSSTRVVD